MHRIRSWAASSTNERDTGVVPPLNERPSSAYYSTTHQSPPSQIRQSRQAHQCPHAPPTAASSPRHRNASSSGCRKAVDASSSHNIVASAPENATDAPTSNTEAKKSRPVLGTTSDSMPLENHKSTSPAAATSGIATTAVNPATAISQPGVAGAASTAAVPAPAKKHNFVVAFLLDIKNAVFNSWFNVLLVFVPAGFLCEFLHAPAVAIFVINAIAVVPLAGLLGYATEAVAHQSGDAMGALLNVTFGNAVELIIFIIALVKNEIAVVQSSILGSILANLLLILGMSFFLGGLRFQEQRYNETVTQMSSCLLSLSVVSLVLPTAFYASFQDTKEAAKQSLKISRGTSLILLFVYVLYLLFQLKSHAYIYEYSPQHVVQDKIDQPGPGHRLWDSSSESDTDSTCSDSNCSVNSRETESKRARVKRALRTTRRRLSSNDNDPNDAGKPDAGLQSGKPRTSSDIAQPPDVVSPDGTFTSPDGTITSVEDGPAPLSQPRRKHNPHKKHKHHRKDRGQNQAAQSPEKGKSSSSAPKDSNHAVDQSVAQSRLVTFAVNDDSAEKGSPSGAALKRPFPGLRSASFNPKAVVPTVFKNTARGPGQYSVVVQQRPNAFLRTNSLPDQIFPASFVNSDHCRTCGPHESVVPASTLTVSEKGEAPMGTWSAITLLLATTILVAFCAEFLVGSIQDVVDKTPIGLTFIGLIILPIVGNAAEHFTAVTVAMKNKMDLAIGVAIGSSIQISLLITPLIVILGWILDRPMTLYFSLFQTVCLFVSAFIVNFLVLDGRSNYLEGALLCATYIIIAIVAFFYPSENAVPGGGIAHQVIHEAFQGLTEIATR